MRFTGSPWTIGFQAEVYNKRAVLRALLLSGGRWREHDRGRAVRFGRRGCLCGLLRGAGQPFFLRIHALIPHDDRNAAVGWIGRVVLQKQALIRESAYL